MLSKKAQSIGVIPVFRNNSDFNIAIVKNTKSGQWGLPKGTPENNEQHLETAMRELKEETGIEKISVKNEPTFIEGYIFTENEIEYNKTNTFFLGFVNEKTIGDKLDQIDEMRWVTIEEAKVLIPHSSTLQVLNDLEVFLKKPRF